MCGLAMVSLLVRFMIVHFLIQMELRIWYRDTWQFFWWKVWTTKWQLTSLEGWSTAQEDRILTESWYVFANDIITFNCFCFAYAFIQVFAFVSQSKMLGQTVNKYSEEHEHAKLTWRHPNAYETHKVVVSYGFTQISRISRWGWWDFLGSCELSWVLKITLCTDRIQRMTQLILHPVLWVKVMSSNKQHMYVLFVKLTPHHFSGFFWFFCEERIATIRKHEGYGYILAGSANNLTCFHNCSSKCYHVV